MTPTRTRLVLLAPNNSGVADSARLLEKPADAAGGGAGERRPAEGIDWGGVLGAAFHGRSGSHAAAGGDAGARQRSGAQLGVTVGALRRRRRPRRGGDAGARDVWRVDRLADGGHLAPVFVEVSLAPATALAHGAADAIARALDASAVGLLE